jgi:hypothetical protein
MSGNKNIVLVMGRPNTGKSASLRNLPQESMVYLNTDQKDLPMRDRFAENIEVADPRSLLIDSADKGGLLGQIESSERCTGAVLDTLTFLMQEFRDQHVTAPGIKDTRAAWGQYGSFYRELIRRIKSGTKSYAIFAHEQAVLNETTARWETSVPVQGAIAKIGIEADFTTILSAKQMPVKELESRGIKNDLLTITDSERLKGIKYVFQTYTTADSLGEKMRSAMDLWSEDELYIDNDMNLVFERLDSYYGKKPSLQGVA